MTSETLATSFAAPSVSPSLADLLSVRPQTQDTRLAPAANPSANTATDTVVPMPFLRSNAEHFSSLGSASPGGSVNTEADAPLAAPVSPALPKTRVPLVLVHGNASDGALVQTWMHRVLGGQELYGVRFQDNFADAVHRQQPQAILIQFIPGAIDIAVTLASQLQIIFPHIPRIAIGHSKQPECMLAALRAGVQDFLDMDGPLDVAQGTIAHLLSLPPVAEAHRTRAPITALLSARAGVGCSLAASHLAWYLQQHLASAAAPLPGATDDEAEELACLLVEMGAPGGDCAIYLNTPGDFSLSDAASHQRRLDRRMAQSALARHNSGLRVLAPARQAKPATPADTEALLSRLSQYFQHIVLDMGAGTSPQLMVEVLPSVSEMWVLCDQSVASVVWTAELLNELDAHLIDRDRMQLVVTRHDPKLELSAAQIAKQLQLPLLGVLPERRRELAQVVNLGALMPMPAKREPYVQALDALLNPLLAQHHPELAERTPASSSPWSALLQRLKKH